MTARNLLLMMREAAEKAVEAIDAGNGPALHARLDEVEHFAHEARRAAWVQRLDRA